MSFWATALKNTQPLRIFQSGVLRNAAAEAHANYMKKHFSNGSNAAVPILHLTMITSFGVYFGATLPKRGIYHHHREFH